MTLNALGIEVPAGGDEFDPQGDMVAMGASFGGRIVVPVANTTARAALAATLSPTPAVPLYVHRADAEPGQELEVTTDGTTWRSITAGRAFAILERNTDVATASGATVVNTAWTSTQVMGMTYAAGIVTVLQTGLYRLGVGAVFGVASAGGRGVYILRNGTAATAAVVSHSGPGNAAFTVGLAHARTTPLVAGDVLRMATFQSSGANLNLVGTGAGFPIYMTAEFVGPA